MLTGSLNQVACNAGTCCPPPPGDCVVAALQALEEGGKAGPRLAPLAHPLHCVRVDALHFPRAKVLDG